LLNFNTLQSLNLLQSASWVYQNKAVDVAWNYNRRYVVIATANLCTPLTFNFQCVYMYVCVLQQLELLHTSKPYQRYGDLAAGMAALLVNKFDTSRVTVPKAALVAVQNRSGDYVAVFRDMAAVCVHATCEIDRQRGPGNSKRNDAFMALPIRTLDAMYRAQKPLGLLQPALYQMASDFLVLGSTTRIAGGKRTALTASQTKELVRKDALVD
jgi:hypothetical protein